MIKRLHSYRLLPFMIIAWTFAVTVARAIRLPNDFAEAHWLLDYRFGFIKRGLIGSICSVATSLLGIPMSSRVILILSEILFCAFCAVLLFLLFRLLRQYVGDSGTQLMALVFASSPFLVMSAHLFGYFDALLYLTAIAAAALVLSDRPYPAAFISVVAMLTHESYLLIGFPLVCLAAFLRLRSSAENNQANRVKHIAALFVPLLVFFGILVFQTFFIDQLALRQQLTDYLGSFNYIPTQYSEVPKWQTTGFFEFLGYQDNFGGHILDPVILASVGPSFLAILYFIHSSFRVRAFRLLSVVTLAVIACPLLLHAVAFDTARISTYPIGGAFIAAWIFTKTNQHQATDDLFALVALPALVLNIFLTIHLMDWEVERFSNIWRILLYAPTLLLVLSIISRRNVQNVVAGINLDEVSTIGAKDGE